MPGKSLALFFCLRKHVLVVLAIDIVADYSHIFLWDEDLGVENFDPDRSQLAGHLTPGLQQLAVKCKTKDTVFVNVVALIQYRAVVDKPIDVIRASVPKLNLDDAFLQTNDIARLMKNFIRQYQHMGSRLYLSIVKEEGLEISQPALDVEKSEVHHAITARWSNSTVHRRAKPSSNSKGCNSESQYPPCTGFDDGHSDRVGRVDGSSLLQNCLEMYVDNADPSEPNPRTEVSETAFTSRIQDIQKEMANSCQGG
ncbi:hypothetical protein Ccrd_013719 [Cynara cardunculus var. scolymus]|uniref:Uncharacterized protein n=1 Tax=Cynara cardunculus var. scolymus TaxID=59895 RepID=A0A103YF33_CYNCS|nr:hypothetical protein Ccrd_013719 [Cynara cardunculus var. scolymus]